MNYPAWWWQCHACHAYTFGSTCCHHCGYPRGTPTASQSDGEVKP